MSARSVKRTLTLIVLTVITLLTFFLAAHWPEAPIDSRHPVTEIVIRKAERELILYSDGKPLKVYRAALGGNPVGQKEREGDRRTPEGEYIISGRNPKSPFHLSLRISYPNAGQILTAKEKGMNPGGDIMIHGIKRGWGWIGKFHLLVDWTTGCIAVTNSEVEEIYRSVPDGTKVVIQAN